MFSTLLSHPDRSIVVVPNRKIVGEILHNSCTTPAQLLHNYGQIRQLDLGVRIRRAADLERGIAVVTEVVGASAFVLKDPVPVIGVSALEDEGIRIAIKPWVKVVDFVAAGAAINRAVVENLRGAGIDYPALVRDVRVLDAA